MPDEALNKVCESLIKNQERTCNTLNRLVEIIEELVNIQKMTAEKIIDIDKNQLNSDKHLYEVAKALKESFETIDHQHVDVCKKLDTILLQQAGKPQT